MEIKNFTKNLKSKMDNYMLANYYVIKSTKIEDEFDENNYHIYISGKFGGQESIMFDVDLASNTAYNVTARGGLTFCLLILQAINEILEEEILNENN